MHAAGRLPDHVTRYNHKNLNRWMIYTVEVERPSAYSVAATLVIAACIPVLIVLGAMILQGIG